MSTVTVKYICKRCGLSQSFPVEQGETKKSVPCGMCKRVGVNSTMKIERSQRRH